ncbi:MAG: hypothetical protein AAGI68_13555 [Planctomycetota bacterium]
MRLHLQPNPDAWQPRRTNPHPTPDTLVADRQALLDALHYNAEAFNLPRPALAAADITPAAPPTILATGHQASLYHPGILAKDFALQALAAQHPGSLAFHLVVDQDIYDTTTAALPHTHARTLHLQTLHLANSNASPNSPATLLPPAQMQPAGSMPAALTQALDQLAQDPRAQTRAQQLAQLHHHLKAPLGLHLPVLFTTDLPRLPAFIRFVDQLLADPHHAIATYNAAVAQHPDAGITPLLTHEDRLELPLWYLDPTSKAQPRQRVYTTPQAPHHPFTLQHDTLPASGSLAPRALTLTAVLRLTLTDAFIHGTGGYAYDQITTQWLNDWLGPSHQPAPVFAASADLYFDFPGLPVASPEKLQRARWLAHHLPHNPDRHLNPNDLTDADRALIARKRHLLDHMHDDRDRTRRQSAFQELHRLNAELHAQHPSLLEHARRQLADAEAGIRNHALATKRDWPYFAYPTHQLNQLATAIQDAFAPHRSPQRPAVGRSTTTP